MSGIGCFTVTFNTALPEGYNQNATHVVGGQATRSSRYYVANPLYTFVPSGATVSVTREVVALQNCNKCHGTLALHGGTRRDTKYCALCHTAQNTDPETGRVLEFKQMVHQIHQGEDLPSVESGTPFYIVGYRQTVADFSEVKFPQDVRNCTTCHSGAAQADNWKTAPSRAACGACHDSVDFATGTNHAGGPQTSDAACTACHGADTGLAPISVKHQVLSLGFEYTVELSLSAPANG